MLWDGSHTSKSYVIDEEKLVSPEHNKTFLYGKDKLINIFSASDTKLFNASFDCEGSAICTNSTLSNWCCLIKPFVSFPYDPASDLKQGVKETNFNGSVCSSII